MIRIYTAIIISILFFTACSSDDNHPKTDQEILAYKEPLVGVNKILVDKDSAEIASYCSRRKLSLSTSASGLWYKIYHTGKGDSAKADNVANIKYKVSLLSGKVCYTSDSLGLKNFLIGQGGVETGLEIGILKMREGDKAKFIMPPNLAYGLIGDENKIPARSIIVYEVELVKLSDK
jgi:FKBP-type peptidyl-prolyl cis-trans isomerase FkpA